MTSSRTTKARALSPASLVPGDLSAQQALVVYDFIESVASAI